eukprot:403354901
MSPGQKSNQKSNEKSQRYSLNGVGGNSGQNQQNTNLTQGTLNREMHTSQSIYHKHQSSSSGNKKPLYNQELLTSVLQSQQYQQNHSNNKTSSIPNMNHYDLSSMSPSKSSKQNVGYNMGSQNFTQGNGIQNFGESQQKYQNSAVRNGSQSNLSSFKQDTNSNNRSPLQQQIPFAQGTRDNQQSSTNLNYSRLNTELESLRLQLISSPRKSQASTSNNNQAYKQTTPTQGTPIHPSPHSGKHLQQFQNVQQYVNSQMNQNSNKKCQEEQYLSNKKPSIENAKAKMSRQANEPAHEEDYEEDYMTEGNDFECLEEEDEEDGNDTSQNNNTIDQNDMDYAGKVCQTEQMPISKEKSKSSSNQQKRQGDAYSKVKSSSHLFSKNKNHQQSFQNEKKYGSVQTSQNLAQKVMNHQQSMNGDRNSKAVGLRGHNDSFQDKSCNSSSRQTPQSQLSKRQTLKSAQGFLGLNNTGSAANNNSSSMSKPQIYKSNKQLILPKDDQQTQSVTTSDSSMKTTIKSTQAFSNESHVKPPNQSSSTLNLHQRKFSGVNALQILQQQQLQTQQQYNRNLKIMQEQQRTAFLNNRNSTLTNQTLQTSYDINNTTNDEIISTTKSQAKLDMILGNHKIKYSGDDQPLSKQDSQVFNILSNENSIEQSQSNDGFSSQYYHAARKSPINLQDSQKKKKKKPIASTNSNFLQQVVTSSVLQQKKQNIMHPPSINSNLPPTYNLIQNAKFTTPKESSSHGLVQAFSHISNENKLSHQHTTEYCSSTIANSQGGLTLKEKIMNEQLKSMQMPPLGSSGSIHQRNSSNNNRLPTNSQTMGSVMQKRIQPNKTTSFAQTSTSKNNHQSSNQVTSNIMGSTLNGSQLPLTRSHTTQSYNNNIPTGPNQKPKKKTWVLLDSEKQTYGDRVPKGYEKLDLLGKGGCALVWLAKNLKTNELAALKQFPKTKSLIDQTARVEVALGRIMFPKHPQTGKTGYGLDPQQYPGLRSIAKLIDDIDEPKDYWLVYEVGSHSLSKHLFDVKGEFFKGERIYHVQHQQFFQMLKQSPDHLRILIKKIAETFSVLSELKIVHADIKPDNILVNFDGREIKDVKLIDFGSAFSYENPSNIQASTPEYLAPEVLEYLDNRAQNTEANGTNSSNLCRKLQPWSYDIWSLGAILLEILTGFPLWLSLKGRISTANGKSIIGLGLFGVQGREGKKILQKQQTILKDLPKLLKKFDCFGLDKDPQFMDLLSRMLDFNPLRRISPEEVINHPFIIGV